MPTRGEGMMVEAEAGPGVVGQRGDSHEDRQSVAAVWYMSWGVCGGVHCPGAGLGGQNSRQCPADLELLPTSCAAWVGGS